MERFEIISIFHTMWGSFPEPVILILKNREILAVNKAAQTSGAEVGMKCSAMRPTERHQGCKANDAFETGKAAYHRVRHGEFDVYMFWLPVEGYPEYVIHFPVGFAVNEKLEY